MGLPRGMSSHDCHNIDNIVNVAQITYFIVEIRQMIYQDLLVTVHCHRAVSRKPSSSCRGAISIRLREDLRPYVEILRVCRTIYLEAIDILYSKNIFATSPIRRFDKLELYLRDFFSATDDSNGDKWRSWSVQIKYMISRIFDDDVAPFRQSSVLLRQSAYTNPSGDHGLLCLNPENLALRQSGPEQGDGLQTISDFPVFLRGIGRTNASKIKALQLTLGTWPAADTYLEFLSEVLRQHIPGLHYLTVGKHFSLLIALGAGVYLLWLMFSVARSIYARVAQCSPKIPHQRETSHGHTGYVPWAQRPAQGFTRSKGAHLRSGSTRMQ